MTWLINCIIGLFNKVISRRPNFEFDKTLLSKILWTISNKGKENSKIDFKYEDINEEMLNNALNPVFRFLNNRHDLSDFRCLQLIKFKLIAKEFLDKYPELDKKIEETLTSFKFWITSPGKDSMCYHSENHQLVFIACEYLSGMLYPDKVFKIDNKTGKEHMAIAKERFDYWMELREKYSYSEFYSSNYAPINLSALSMILEYSNNEEMKKRCERQLDVILNYYATIVFEKCAANASGRDYSRNMMNCSFQELNSYSVINTVWEDHELANNDFTFTCWLFADMYLNGNCYKLKDEIYNRYFEKETITKRKFGLDLKDYKKEGLYSNDTKALMMRLGSGALTNPEIINLTYDMMYKYKLWSNDFFYWLRYIDVPLLRWLGLMPWYSEKVKIFLSRQALGIANVYTYRNEHFKMSTIQKYQVGFGGAQKNTISLVLPGGVTIYTNHPYVNSNLENHNYTNTPSYFAGYAFAPHAVQDKNVALLIYDLPKHKCAFQFSPIQKFTHAYFPIELFDEYKIEGKYAFARVKDTYVTLIGKNDLYLKDVPDAIFDTTNGLHKDRSLSFDLVQDGTNTYWVYEISSKDKETFEEFIQRIKSNNIEFENNKLVYCSNNKYEVEYNKDFYINDELINTDYSYDVGDNNEENN